MFMFKVYTLRVNIHCSSGYLSTEYSLSNSPYKENSSHKNVFRSVDLHQLQWYNMK